MITIIYDFPVYRQVQDTLEDSVSDDLEAVSCDNIELVKDVLDELSQTKSAAAAELHKILTGDDIKVNTHNLSAYSRKTRKIV